MNAARKEFDLIDKELFALIQKQLKTIKNGKNVKKGRKIKQKRISKPKEPESIEISKQELKTMGYENDPAIQRIYKGILKKKK